MKAIIITLTILALSIPAFADTLPSSLTVEKDGTVTAKLPELKNIVKVGIDKATSKPIWSVLVRKEDLPKLKDISKTMDRIEIRKKAAKIYIKSGLKDEDGNDILIAISYDEWVSRGKPEYVRWIELHRWADPPPGVVEVFLIDDEVIIADQANEQLPIKKK